MKINNNFIDGIFGSTKKFKVPSKTYDKRLTFAQNAGKTLYSYIYDNPFLKAILDSLNVGVNIVDIGRRIVYVNKEQLRIHEIPEEDYVGKIIDEIAPESAHIYVLKTGLKTQREKATISLLKPVDVRTICIPIVDDEDHLIGSFGLAKALSDYREVFFEIKNSKDVYSKFSSIFDDFQEAVAATDIRGKILYANLNFAEIFGVNVRAILENNQKPGELSAVIKNSLAEADKPHRNIITLEGKKFRVNSFPFTVENEVKGCLCTLREVLVTRPAPKPLVLTNELDTAFYSRDDLSGHFKEIIGNSPLLLEQISIADRAAATNCKILIQGGSGTGKELLAHAIHKASERSSRPFVTINCAALPDSLLESELFGYEEGAFTGAKKGGKPGKFELANGGTLFLDEIGDMSLYMQAKLLRILQDMQNERQGGTNKTDLDVRILSATNVDLEEAISNKQFREDLFYRISVVIINMPSLKERKEDIPLLVKYFMSEFLPENADKMEISDMAMQILTNYDWPGNVRELKNVVENTMVLTRGSVIQPYHLPPHLWDSAQCKEAPAREKDFFTNKSMKLADVIGEVEKRAIEEVLRLTGNNKSAAIEALGISRRAFYYKLEKYHID